jgi:hypothetical protein
MNDNEFKDAIKYFLDVKGIQKVLEAVATDIKESERQIEERHNRKLGFALELIFPVLMQAFPGMKKKDRDLVQQLLLSPLIKEALSLIQADHPGSSPAMKAAYAQWLNLREPRGVC